MSWQWWATIGAFVFVVGGTALFAYALKRLFYDGFMEIAEERRKWRQRGRTLSSPPAEGTFKAVGTPAPPPDKEVSTISK